MRLMERQGASIAAMCWSAITRVRLTAASAACLAAVMAVSMPGPLAGQNAPDWAPGTWAGTLDAGEQSIRIVYDISRGEDGTLRGSMAVPTQGASDIPLNELGVEGRTLRMTFPVPGGGSYEGELGASGTEIRGTFTQGPRSFPLDLERVSGEGERPSRPQEPAPPLPYQAEEVSFTNPASGLTLTGTVTIPDGVGPFPGVVLVSGAGAQDRDGSMFGHRPMLVIADHLTRRRIAVLRFDDRGVGGSEGDFSAATPKDLSTDVGAAAAFLAARPSVIADGVGVAGHSDGALAAALAAQRDDGIAFLVILAGSGLPGVETAADQAERLARVGGAPEEIVAMNRRLYGELGRVAADSTGDGDIEARLRTAARSVLDEFSPELRRRAFGGAQDQVVEQLVGAFGTPWTRFTLRHDPRETLEGVRVPVLALVGEKDLQLAAVPHLSAISGAVARGGNEEVTVHGMPGLNHLLQEAESGSPSEFARLEQTVAPAALELLSGWITGRAP